MVSIGGNIDLQLEYASVTTSDIGEDIKEWLPLMKIRGFLDLMNNGKDYATYNRAMEDSTNVFICDYVSIDKPASDLRAVVNGKEYDVTYIDDPMELHKHLEIFLKRVGD